MEIFSHENAPLFFAFVYFQIAGNLLREDESAKEKQDRKHRHNRAFPSNDGIVPFGLSVLSKLQASKLDSEPVQKSSRYMSRVMRKHAFVYIYGKTKAQISGTITLQLISTFISTICHNKSMSSTVLLNSVLFIVPHTDTDNIFSCMLEICALIMARFYAKLL